MSSPTRKRQHLQQSPPTVKEEQQEQEEDTHLTGAAAGISANQGSSSNFEDSNNTTGNSAGGGNGGDDMNELKLKMAALEAKNQILEGKLENQELQLHAINEEQNLAYRVLWTRQKEVEEQNKKTMDEFVQKLTALEAKHQQEIAELQAINERNQQQLPIARKPDCVVVNMSESQGTSSNSNVAPTLAPSHSAQQQEEEEEVLVMEEAKRLCNPAENFWNSKSLTSKAAKATMEIILPDQLTVHNSSPTTWGNIVAQKGFLLYKRSLQQNDFARPILYYYEITTTSALVFNGGRLCIGFSKGTIKKNSCIGQLPNTYAMQDDEHDYCFISGNEHYFEWPAGAIKPILSGCGDVFGCGLVLSADDKLAIFFTVNGILMGKQFPIFDAGFILYPTVQLNVNVTVEANFGQKPFKYSIHKCSGLILQW